MQMDAFFSEVAEMQVRIMDTLLIQILCALIPLTGRCMGLLLLPGAEYHSVGVGSVQIL